MKQTLSLALIMKNEEDNIRNCLNSFKNVVDEIIVIDTGSTDNSKKIALEFTDKVYDFKWVDDFSKARNFSFEKCTSDWIIWADSDDILLPQDAQKIKNLNYDNKEIIICKYVYNHDELGNPGSILERERIIKRSLNLKWQKAIHEYIPLNGKISREDIEIHHYKKQNNSERNLSILQKIIQTDQDPRNFFYYGKELFYFNKFEESNEILKKFVLMNGWIEDICNAYEIIAKNSLILKNEKDFLENIFKSIEIEPTRAEPCFELGSFYMNKGIYKKAIFWFEQCLNVKRSPELLSIYVPEYYTWRPAIQLVLCYNWIGEIQKAYDYNELYLKFKPNNAIGLNNKNILENSELRKKLKDGLGKKLHLGCGNKKLEDFINVDIIKLDTTDEVFDMKDIPYKDNTISCVRSEHSLEHLSFENAKKTLKEIFRVLQPGGTLELYLPDLEECCKKYLAGNNLRMVNYIPEKDWYRFTIFGIQKDANGSIAKHQFHLSGYSKQEIKELLEEIGFIVDYCENY